MQKQKEWKEIVGFEGKYTVSNYGDVMILKPENGGSPRILRPQIDRYGYVKVSLYKDKHSKQYTVHRLVARMFIPNPMFYTEINHKDGNKQNNCADNLEWCTRSENMSHAFAMGLKYNKTGADSPLAKKCYQYDLKGNFIREWGSITDVAVYFNDVTGNVSAACSGKYNTFHNFIWSYKKEKIDVNAHRNAKGERTYQYSKDGKLIAEYFNMEDAVSGSGVDKSNITKCCLGKRKTAGGFIWSHTPLNEEENKN